MKKNQMENVDNGKEEQMFLLNVCVLSALSIFLFGLSH